MKIISKRIKGSGRGKQLGYPTINLRIPKNFNFLDGVYAVNVSIKGINYQGTLHYGPVPTFNQSKQSLEIHLLNTSDKDLPPLENKEIKIEIIKKIRKVIKFENKQDLKNQISKDIKKTKKILNETNN